MKEKKSNIGNGSQSIHNFSEAEKVKFRSLLLEWYDEKKRDLPWRKQALNPDINQRAYAVWVSEVMLQQTQVATVINYYNKWMEKWPKLQDLAKVDLEEVNELWSGLGYYSRGRRLHEGAKKVVEELGGEMPKTADDLQKLLPGVGRYTAGAIASIAYNQVTGLVDGNVIRVLCRMRILGGDSMGQAVQEKLWSHANSVVDPERPGDFNQGMMELGATVCTPKSPSCDSCPVREICLAYSKVENEKQKSAKKILTNNNNAVTDIECLTDSCPLCFQDEDKWEPSNGVENYPRKGKKKAAREERTDVCIVCQRGQDGRDQYLIVQRPSKGLLAGLWEFPSLLQAEKSENLAETVLDKACGASLQTAGQSHHIGEVVHIFSHIHQTYVIQSATVKEGEVTLETEQPPSRWVTKEEFFECAVSTGMKKVFKAYEASLSSKPGSKKIKKTPSKPDDKQRSISCFFKPKASS
ncbi:adenine DNA glycosylase-like isoform X2 [Mizuhopecten yessoensis]|uniref:adenine DNA glycosylase-like isoform X2 n=1 Tax=Mizuhopecten yessoensis TaxID=6573 RepID=UPI000B45E27C|nr:adenine DNA glycosylase-like isoform X2 [Mizuhopecten yessoensis]